MKYLALLPLLLIVSPVFAQTVDPTTQFMPSSSSIKDVYHTLIDKLSSGPNNDGSLSNIGNETKNTIDAGLHATGAIKQLVGSVFGFIALKFFGKELPNWFVPALVIIAIIVAVVGFWRHLLRVLLISLIIGIVVFLALLLGGQFIP